MVAVFVLATIIAAVAIEYFRTRRVAQPAPEARAAADRFVVPRGFFLGKGHTWAELLTNGEVRVGADDFLQKLVGSVDSVEFVPADGQVKKGEPLFRLRKENRVLTILSPITGKIVEVNRSLAKHPGVINSDPYLAGWVALVDPTNIGAELKLMSVADEASKWLRGEVSRFRNFIKDQAAKMLGEEQYAAVGVTLLDGGTPMAGVLEKTDAETWSAFEQNFLREQN